MDSNHRPHPYQGCALTNLATDPNCSLDIFLSLVVRVYKIGKQWFILLEQTCEDTRVKIHVLKEVIQPQVPLRLPCYDFTPVIDHKVVSDLPKVSLPTSFAANSHGVTGGVYKARERIHRDVADSRLLAIPTSRSRVADSDPD